MSVQATKVIKWIEDETPPLTWHVIGIKLIDMLIDQNIRLTKIDDQTIFNEVILNEINGVLDELYSRKLPNFSCTATEKQSN